MDVRLCHCTFGECGKDEQKYNEPPLAYLRSGGHLPRRAPAQMHSVPNAPLEYT